MPSGMLPFFPAGVTHINHALAFKKEDGRVTYFNYSMPIFIHDESDMASFRMITAQFCVNGNVKQADVIRAFGAPPISVKRSVKKYRDQGPKGFYTKPKGRGPSKLTPAVLKEVQGLLNNDHSVAEIADEMGLKVNTINKAIIAETLTRPKKNHLSQIEATSKSQRSEIDSQAVIGMGATDVLGRIAASVGLISSVNIILLMPRIFEVRKDSWH